MKPEMELTIWIFSIILAFIVTVVIAILIENWYNNLPETKRIRRETEEILKSIKDKHETRK